MSLLGIEMEQEEEDQGNKRRNRFFTPRIILVFFTILGWSAVILSNFDLSFRTSSTYAVCIGLFGAFLPELLSLMDKHRIFRKTTEINITAAIESKGEVLQPIPPFQNGSGKVQLELREFPFELEAVTSGVELLPGAPIRVVDVIDNRVLLVEPLEGIYPNSTE